MWTSKSSKKSTKFKGGPEKGKFILFGIFPECSSIPEEAILSWALQNTQRFCMSGPELGHS